MTQLGTERNWGVLLKRKEGYNGWHIAFPSRGLVGGGGLLSGTYMGKVAAGDGASQGLTGLEKPRQRLFCTKLLNPPRNCNSKVFVLLLYCIGVFVPSQTTAFVLPPFWMPSGCPPAARLTPLSCTSHCCPAASPPLLHGCSVTADPLCCG